MINIITGFFSGIISGMGIGGGAVLIPALILTESINQQTAQGINLTYFIPTAVIALIIHIKNKRVELKSAAIIGLCGVLGAVLGSWVAISVSGALLRRAFGVFLLAIGMCEVYKGIKIGNR